MESMGLVVRRCIYIYLFISSYYLSIPTPLVSAIFWEHHPYILFVHFVKNFLFFINFNNYASVVVANVCILPSPCS